MLSVFARTFRCLLHGVIPYKWKISEGGWGQVTASVLFMGTCKVVKGTYGYTSVIYDTALYNYVSAFNSGTFYENGSLTTEGQTFYNLLHDYCRIARFSFGCNLDRGGDQIDYRAALSVFKIFFLNADVFSLLLTSSRYELFNSNVAGSYVYLEPGVTVGVIKSFLSNNGTSNYNIYGSCEMYPYGFVMNSPYFRLRISIPIYNDDGSSATSIGLTMQDAGTVTGQKWGSSASFINSFPTWLGALPPWSDADDTFNGAFAIRALRTGIEYNNNKYKMCVGVFDEVHNSIE